MLDSLTCDLADDPSGIDLSDPLVHVTGERCPFCLGREFFQLNEVWGHEFKVDACCGAREELLTADMADDPDYAALVLRLVNAEGAVGFQLRRVLATDEGFGPWVLDYQLEVRPVPQATAKAFIRAHHRHNPPPAGWKTGAGLFNGRTLLGVVWVGRPANRVLQARGALEVNRLCLDHSGRIPQELLWKACSLAYGWAAKQARQLGATQLYTYTLQSEAGMSLRYARWKMDATTKGGSWDCPSRPRTDKASTEKKVRWRAW